MRGAEERVRVVRCDGRAKEDEGCGEEWCRSEDGEDEGEEGGLL